MPQHKSGAQEEEKKKRDDNEGRGLQTLFHVGMKKKQDDLETYTDENLEEGESVDGCREEDSLYGNEIEANKETNSGARTNTIDIDINSEPGACRADKSVDSKNQSKRNY